MDAFRLSGRRQRVRRGAEREGPFFTDRFDALILGFIVAVLVLCIVDGVLTIELLDVNSEEANPVMKFLLDRGHLPFLVGKYAITAAGLPFLAVYKNWPLFGTRFAPGSCCRSFSASTSGWSPIRCTCSASNYLPLSETSSNC